MAGWTNKGKAWILDVAFRNATEPTVFYLALTTDAPTADTNTLSDLTECANGNGYTTGGISIARNSTDFDVNTEDDTNDRGLVQIKDETWTASGGAIPASGDAPRYVVLTDDNGTVGSRQVFAYWDLGAAITTPSGGSLILVDFELRLNES